MPPPTPRDADQSQVHHLDSALYNARHGAAHATETVRHLNALKGRMQGQPRLSQHFAAIGQRPDASPDQGARDTGGDSSLITPRSESTDRDTQAATRDAPSARALLLIARDPSGRDTESPREDATEPRDAERPEAKLGPRMPTGRLTSRNRGGRR